MMETVLHFKPTRRLQDLRFSDFVIAVNFHKMQWSTHMFDDFLACRDIPAWLSHILTAEDDDSTVKDQLMA